MIFVILFLTISIQNRILNCEVIEINIFDNIVIKKISDVLYLNIEKEKMNITNRTSCGISVVLEGEIIYTHNGKNYTSDKDHVLIYPINQSYSWYCTNDAKLFVINFECDVNYAPNEFLSLSVTNNTAIFEQCKNLHSHYISMIHSKHTYYMSLMYKILFMIDYNNELDIPSVMSKSVKYIESNFKNSNLSTKEIAFNANISEIYLRKLFIKHYGTSPMKYVKQLRLETAKIMLASNDKSIEEIANDVGYSCIYVFSRTFKKQIGVSPNQYRKNINKNM